MALQQEYHARGFETAEAALEAMKDDCPDLVLLDVGLPGMSGIDALNEMKRLYPDMIVIMITAFEDVSTVISAMKQGAHDYLLKPIHIDPLLITIENALETIRLRKEVQALQEQYLNQNIPCFIGESKSIQNVMDFVDRVAKSPDTPILICGETGTGKELIAGAIHYKSPNFKGPFVPLNCAAIPKELLESELFGYEKGAFSGAYAGGKKGLVEEAAGGTLFLDEVGELSMEAQAKMLRFLEEGEYYRVGGTRKLTVRTRVVSATNKNLEGLIAEDAFRQDLFYRLAVIKVDIPSLTKRAEDIIPIASHFLFEFSRKFGKEFTGIGSDAEAMLLNYDWKGNIRELKNVIERAVLTGSGQQLTAEDLAIPGESGPASTPHRENQPIQIPEQGVDLDAVLQSIERKYFEASVDKAGGNESQAARLLNLNYYTYRHRKKKLYSG
jgi:DNA-binding NtrC family response regulator